MATNKNEKTSGSTLLDSEAISIWGRMQAEKSAYMTRAEKCSTLTLPYVFPKDGSNSTTTYKYPVASLGPSAVKNMASRMLEAIYPMGNSYLRYPITAEAEAKYTDNPDAKVKAETVLDRIAMQVSSMMSEKGRRSIIYEALLHTIITGNVLVKYDVDTAAVRIYSMRHYGVVRDSYGTPLIIATKDYVLLEELDDDILAEVGLLEKKASNKYATTVEVYTAVRLEGKFYVETTYINAKPVGSTRKYPRDACPYIAVRLRTEFNSSYGRSYVEDFIGALGEINALTHVLNRSIAADAKTIFMVRPGSPSSYNVKSLALADSGSFVPGEATDISTLQAGKQATNQVTMSAIAMHEAAIRAGFLMADSVQRNAERVTAEEIRYMAAAQEQQIGTIYHLLTEELVKPLAILDQRYLERKGSIPNLDAIAKTIGIDSIAVPTPITGEATLMRARQVERISQFINVVSTLGVVDYISMPRLITSLANAMELSTSGLLKTDEEMTAEQQAKQQAEMMQAVAPNVVNGEYAIAQQQQQQAVGTDPNAVPPQ